MPLDDTLLQLSNAFILPDGRIRFSIERRDGQSLTVSCQPSETPDIIQFIAGLARAANEAQGFRPDSRPEAGHYAPIPAAGIGFGASATPAETSLLVANLSGIPLAIEIPNSDSVRLADDFSKVAKAQSASGDRKN